MLSQPLLLLAATAASLAVLIVTTKWLQRRFRPVEDDRVERMAPPPTATPYQSSCRAVQPQRYRQPPPAPRRPLPLSRQPLRLLPPPS